MPIRSTLVPVLLAWSLAAGITLWIYAAVSLARFGDLLAAAVRASAPAMWFPPAMLLVTVPEAGVRLAGLLLVANTVRLLVSRRAPGPHLRARRRARRSASVPLFLYPARQPWLFWREILPPILGAFAFQALLTAEQFPASASMQLETTGGTVDLGTQIFELTPAREQTVEFDLPPPPRRLRVSAIRVFFHRNPKELDQSTRVAIQGFTLVPRGSTSQD